jgi:tetratricopeptide (TPR) repeat protein
MSPRLPSGGEAAASVALVPVEEAATRVGLDSGALRRWLEPLETGAMDAAAIGCSERDAEGYAEHEVEWLRWAKRLAEERVSVRRIRRALEGLRHRAPLTGDGPWLVLGRAGSEIVARDRTGEWSAETGQGRLDLTPSAIARIDGVDDPWVVSGSARQPAVVSPAAPTAGSRAAGVIDLAAARRRRDANDLAAEVVAAGEQAGALYSLAADEADPERAIELLRAVLVAHPDHVEAHLDLGALLHERSAVEEAKRHYRAAVRLAPEHPTAWFDLGVALEDGGDEQGALEAYRRSQELEPGDPDVCFNISRLLEQSGDRAGALAQLTRYRRLLGGRGE